MKKLFKEFAAFINKGNALALAIGVIIGGAFTAIVSTINTKIILLKKTLKLQLIV